MKNIKRTVIPRKFTLGKEEKLKSRKRIAELFSEGDSITVPPLRLLYRTGIPEPGRLRAAFSVSAKNFRKAVDRNRIKRQMREAFRLHKDLLRDRIAGSPEGISVFLLYTGKNLPEFVDIYRQTARILEKLGERLGDSGS